MGITNSNRDLKRPSLLLISRKYLTLSGTPEPFFRKLISVGPLLTLLFGVNFFLIGALAWFFKITNIACFESVEVFRKDAWRPHKELRFDWSTGLSTDVFLSIRANVRPPSFQGIPTILWRLSFPSLPHLLGTCLSLL